MQNFGRYICRYKNISRYTYYIFYFYFKQFRYLNNFISSEVDELGRYSGTVISIKIIHFLKESNLLTY